MRKSRFLEITAARTVPHIHRYKGRWRYLSTRDNVTVTGDLDAGWMNMMANRWCVAKNREESKNGKR